MNILKYKKNEKKQSSFGMAKLEKKQFLVPRESVTSVTVLLEGQLCTWFSVFGISW